MSNHAERELTQLQLHQEHGYVAIRCRDRERAGAGPAHIGNVAAAEILDEQAAVAVEVVAHNAHLALAHSVRGVSAQ